MGKVPLESHWYIDSRFLGEQPSAVKTMIDFCMTSGLQYEFNWEGRLGWKTKTNTCKKGFKNTTLCGIIINILVNKTQLSTECM
ncbi:uncharacterized protein LOC135216412 isoform X2 [Macrobrachium nipponense]|uniref:uncharacterized protein LOC135216412 isoform X2 n=1 Tax=Macrobrachium nipponense TaxID=159736 RepID=UPI0030C7F53A